MSESVTQRRPCISVDPAVPAEAPYDFAAINRVNDTHPRREWKSYDPLTQGFGFQSEKRKALGLFINPLTQLLNSNYC